MKSLRPLSLADLEEQDLLDEQKVTRSPSLQSLENALFFRCFC
jgi:hypothetical protein